MSATIIKKSLPRRVGRSLVVGIQVLCAVHLFNEHIAEIRPCTGASMYPTLGLRGDYILQERLTTRLHLPLARGTLVTAISPLDPSHHILKRVVGLAGDTICVDPSGESGQAKRNEYVVVPKGRVWLSGDNASNSTDSREYGPVPEALLRGRVIARIYPSPRWFTTNFRPVVSP